MNKLTGKIAVVAGATRGTGSGIAVMLREAGATVYCTGRSVRGNPSDLNRPETIEETAEMVSAQGGVGIPVQVDHTDAQQVRNLFERIKEEQNGVLDLLVNDIWGGEKLTKWNTPFWEHYGVREENWQDAVNSSVQHAEHFGESETPYFIGRAIAALAADPQVMQKTGQALSSWSLSDEYGFCDVDGRKPHWGNYAKEHGF